MKFWSYATVFASLFLCSLCNGQDVYQLWKGSETPYLKTNELKEYEDQAWGVTCVFNVTRPTLTVYKAEGARTDAAVILLPGGGYSLLAIYHEGHDLAKVLAKTGITAAVLKYRIPDSKSSDQPGLVPLADTRRALELLRSLSARYGFHQEKLGLIGFSAGSHLATVASVHESRNPAENPNFSALIYGVTRLSKANIEWLETDLYYRKMTEEELAWNDVLGKVSEKTPPAFLVHAYDDDVCPVAESTDYAAKLFEHGVSAEMHLFPKGGHGFGMGREEDGTRQWVDLFIQWVKRTTRVGPS